MKNDNEDIEYEIRDMQLWPDFNTEMQKVYIYEPSCKKSYFPTFLYIITN